MKVRAKEASRAQGLRVNDMAAGNGNKQLALIMSTGSCRCALALSHVVETLRPLPIQPLGDMPAFVPGPR